MVILSVFSGVPLGSSTIIDDMPYCVASCVEICEGCGIDAGLTIEGWVIDLCECKGEDEDGSMSFNSTRVVCVWVMCVGGTGGGSSKPSSELGSEFTSSSRDGGRELERISRGVGIAELSSPHPSESKTSKRGAAAALSLFVASLKNSVLTVFCEISEGPCGDDVLLATSSLNCVSLTMGESNSDSESAMTLATCFSGV